VPGEKKSLRKYNTLNIWEIKFMKRIAFYILVVYCLVGCTQSNNGHEIVDIIDTTEQVTVYSEYVVKRPVEMVKNDMEFFALATKYYLPCSFNEDGGNGYFSDLSEANLPVLNTKNGMNELVKKDIVPILQKQYSKTHDILQYIINNEYTNYRMVGLIEVKQNHFLSKLIYLETLTLEGGHVGVLLMVNMDSDMEKNLGNVILAIKIGGESDAPYFVKLSSKLKLDAQNNIIVNQIYQVEDSVKFLENTKRTILINTCSDCKGDSKALVTYE
jgi:hypothetical protein